MPGDKMIEERKVDLDMYYLRIVFFVTNNYDLDLKDEKILFQTEGSLCNMKVVRIFGKVKVILLYGGFSTEEVAVREGEKLFFNVKKSFIKQGIPINISGGLRVLDTIQTSFDTGEITQAGLEYLQSTVPELANRTVKSEVLGMGIYQLDEDISEVKFVAHDVEIIRTVKVPVIKMEDYREDDKLKIAYSLLNSSNAVNDLRASFILKVSSIESLVPEDLHKDENYCSVINQINKMITKDNIKLELSDVELDKFIQKVKGAVGALKKKSIGEKCRDLIVRCNIHKQYQGKDVISFFNECYNLRSEFVHTETFKNKVDETKKIRELELYLEDLNSLVLDILECYESYI
ncbi:MAG: hypothetical protein ACQEXX_24280 [Bacillota bacterium]